MPTALSVEIRFQDSQLVIYPSLKVINRRKSAGQLCSEVDAALTQPGENQVTDVVVDLEQVTWISSVGLNELIQLQAKTRASGVGLRFRSLSETVREVFRITRLERTFELDGTNRNDSAPQDGKARVGLDHSVTPAVTV